MNRGLHGNATIVLSSLVAGLGLVMIVIALVGGGGPAAQGVLVGVLFLLAGAGRAWVAWKGDALVRRDADEEDRTDG